jgi:putative transposase
VIEINTRQTRLSQFDHTTGEYIKKPLSPRMYVFGDGATTPVQRDLYSAFLATRCDTNTLDICQVEQTWPAAEPLLRRAMSRL